MCELLHSEGDPDRSGYSCSKSSSSTNDSNDSNDSNGSRDTYYLSGDPMHHSARRVFDPLVDKLMPCFMAHFRMNSQM